MNCQFKFTIMSRFFLFVSLTFVTTLTFLFTAAQIKPSTAEERWNGFKKRKLLEGRSVVKDIKFRPPASPKKKKTKLVKVE